MDERRNEVEKREHDEKIRDSIAAQVHSAVEPLANLLYDLRSNQKEQLAYSTSAHHRTDEILTEIKTQVLKTNGRVTFLEKTAWTLAGALAVFSLVESDKILTLFK